MLGQFAEGLIAELNRAEADPGVALLLRRMQLAHGEHALAVALRVEGHRDVKAARIVILIRVARAPLAVAAAGDQPGALLDRQVAVGRQLT